MADHPHDWERDEWHAAEDADGYPDTPTLAEIQWAEHEANAQPSAIHPGHYPPRRGATPNLQDLRPHH